MKRVKFLKISEDKKSLFFKLSDQRIISIPKAKVHLKPDQQESIDNLYEINSEGNIVSCKLLDLKIHIEDVLSPIDVQDVMGLKFGFSDIIYLDDRAIQRALKETDSKDLGLALKDSKFIGHYAVNLSKRAFQMLSDEMAFMGPIKHRDQQEAKLNIEITVNGLIDNGEIVFSKETIYEREVPVLEEISITTQASKKKVPFQINYPILLMILISLSLIGYVSYEYIQLKNSINAQSKIVTIPNK